MSQYFYDNEKLLLVDAYYGVNLDSYEKPGFPDRQLIATLVADVKYSLIINELDNKWNVNADALIQKLTRMDYKSKRVLMQRIYDFWHKDKRDWISYENYDDYEQMLKKNYYSTFDLDEI